MKEPPAVIQLQDLRNRPPSPSNLGGTGFTPPKIGGHRGPVEGLGGTGGQNEGICVSPKLVQANCIQLNQHPFTKKKVRTLGHPAPLSKSVAAKVLPQKVNEQQRPLLPFPITSSVTALRQRTIEGLRRIESQAERINQLSADLETAV